MSALIPFKFEGQEIRTVMRGEAPWWVAADVCKVLEHTDTSKAVARLDEDEKGTNIVRTPSGDQEMLIINESGLWSLVLTSRKPAAKRFKKWVTAEVLPQIRKTGRYEPQEAPTPEPETILITKDEYIDLLRGKLGWFEMQQPRERGPYKGKITDTEVAEMHRLKAAGLTVEEIARRLGRGTGTVSQILRGAGHA